MLESKAINQSPATLEGEGGEGEKVEGEAEAETRAATIDSRPLNLTINTKLKTLSNYVLFSSGVRLSLVLLRLLLLSRCAPVRRRGTRASFL